MTCSEGFALRLSEYGFALCKGDIKDKALIQIRFFQFLFATVCVGVLV